MNLGATHQDMEHMREREGGFIREKYYILYIIQCY